MVNYVDETSHNKRKEKTKKKEMIIKMLEAKKEELSILQLFEGLASKDKEVAKLLEELKGIE